MKTNSLWRSLRTLGAPARPLLAAAALGFVVGACVGVGGRRAVSPAPVATSHSTRAADSALDSVDATAPARSNATAEPPSSWSDPRVVAALTLDCDASSAIGADPEEDTLHCFYGFPEQSCSVDPCIGGERDPCAVDCGDQCVSCSTRCRAQCQQCRASCDAGDCRASCASLCAACLDGCLQTRDRCATAVCARRYEACTREKATAFRRSGCAANCARCTRDCGDTDETPSCIDRCLSRRGRCTREQRSICAVHGVEYGQQYLDAGVDGR
ncbi:MAG: hypothetical protein U0269_01785 [Polyangiales bacterium]